MTPLAQAVRGHSQLLQPQQPGLTLDVNVPFLSHWPPVY
jgi:hypothetical protein